MIVLLSAVLLAAAGPSPSPAVLEAGLNGSWKGSLGYRDYQSNEIQEIPVSTRIEALSDGATVLRIPTFDDGPNVGNVIITTASLHDPVAGIVTLGRFRKGRPVELSTAQLSVTAFKDATHWTVTSEEDGRDDDKPALIRVTEVRDGDMLTATKDVQLKAGSAGWQFRNRTRLMLEIGRSTSDGHR
ncbi:MAG: hypothetical protein H7267_04885 [Sandarakinorhabdus sp.]|nr:hypothetical protein [Sandarakinorhabdus sp.]